MNFETKPSIGHGIYTVAEIAALLRLPYGKVYRWMNNYWDGELAETYNLQYSWNITGSRAVSFHTFVELYTLMRFTEAGVKPSTVLKAHKELAAYYETPFPFAHKEVLDRISSDGRRIYLLQGESIITLDGRKQFNLGLIREFFVKLEFDDQHLASRYWPLGRGKGIVVDPQRKFGRPVILSKNITPEQLYDHYRAGDPLNYIAEVYQIPLSEVEDAIAYCEAA